MDDVFRYEKVTDHIYRIYGVGEACMYFIKGSARGMLIDTAYGIGDLKAFVDQTFMIPYDVFVTHGHWDHANGIGQWNEVYMKDSDRELYRQFTSISFRKTRLARTIKNINEYPDDLFVPEYQGEYLDLNEGMRFDLGDVCVEMIETPGHTKGIVSFLIEEDRALMLGDACGDFTYMFREESSTIEQYQHTLYKLMGLSDRFDIILRQHGSFLSPKTLIADNLEIANAILDGTDDRVEWEYMGQKVFIAKKMDPATHKRADGKPGNIVYSKEKIR